MLSKKLAILVAVGLCSLKATGNEHVMTSTSFLDNTRQFLGNAASAVADVLLGREDDLLGDSICVRARPKARKPGGMKSIPVKREKENAEEQPAEVGPKQHLKSSAECGGYDSDDERSSVGHDRSQGLSPSTTPQFRSHSTSTAASDDQFSLLHDRSGSTGSAQQSSCPPSFTPPPPLARHGTEQFGEQD